LKNNKNINPNNLGIMYSTSITQKHDNVLKTNLVPPLPGPGNHRLSRKLPSLDLGTVYLKR